MKKQTFLRLLVAFLSLPLIVGCSKGSQTYYKPTPTSSYTPSFDPIEKIEATKVYDAYLDDGYPETLNFTVKEFSSGYFKVDDGKIIDPLGNAFADIGMALYLYDANDDGYRDFCFTERTNSGSTRTYLRIFDYKNKKEIFNNERTYINVYGLYFEIKDKELRVFKTNKRYNDDHYGEGQLEYKNGVVDIKWDNYFNIANMDVKLTFADPNNTPVAVNKQGDKYTYNVDKTYNYLLHVDVEETLQTVYPGSLSTPVSFSPSNVSVSIEKSKNPFLYMFSFAGNLRNSTLKLEFSGFEKTLVFNLLDDNALPFKQHTLGELIGWPKENEPVINELNIKEELPGTSVSDGNYGIGTLYTFTSKTSLSTVTYGFDNYFAEIDPSSFLFESTKHYTYILKTDKGNFFFEIVGKYLYINYRYYTGQEVIINADTNKADSKPYFFDSAVKSLGMHSLVGEDVTIINHPEDFLFTKKVISSNEHYEATHRFEIRGAYYYVVGKKKFIDKDAHYVFEIISDADFSSLFND